MKQWTQNKKNKDKRKNKKMGVRQRERENVNLIDYQEIIGDHEKIPISII